MPHNLKIQVPDIDKLYVDAPEISGEKQFFINVRKGDTVVMNGFHMHSHYEISFIESGNVTVYLSDRIYTGSGPRVVLIPPFCQHFIVPEPNTNYKRTNVSFTEEFVSELPDEWSAVRGAFQKSGAHCELTSDTADKIRQILALIHEENNDKRTLLLLLYYVSTMNTIAENGEPGEEIIPPYLINAVKFINDNYKNKITTQIIAEHLQIGRTTLTMGFRETFGLTVHDYLIKIRLKQADILRKSGATVETAAAECGFSDSGSYIRAYRRVYGKTPTGRI